MYTLPFECSSWCATRPGTRRVRVESCVGADSVVRGSLRRILSRSLHGSAFLIHRPEIYIDTCSWVGSAGVQVQFQGINDNGKCRKCGQIPPLKTARDSDRLQEAACFSGTAAGYRTCRNRPLHPKLNETLKWPRMTSRLHSFHDSPGAKDRGRQHRHFMCK